MLNDLKLQQKLLLLPGLVVVALGAVLSIALWFGQQNARVLDRVQHGYAPASEASRDLEALLTSLQRDLQDAVAAEEEDGLTTADGKHDRFLALLTQTRENPVIEAGRLEAVRRAMEEYYQLARSTSLHMIRKDAPAQVSENLPQLTSKFNAIRAELNQGADHDRKEMDGAFEQARSLQRRSSGWMVGSLLIALTLLVLLSTWIGRGITRSTLALTSAARRIATENDLRTDVSVTSKDEIGQLGAAFQAMVEKLRSISLGLKDTMKELGASMGEFSSLAREQTQVLQRQAASVAETSATTQEIKQTSAVAANKGESVLQVAAKAEGLAASGQEAVARSMDGLRAIRSQVDAMVRGVGELANRIQLASEIVERVREIATQSNMLALNAAIEATKAGEYGKGFSVVAREIRSLADQSLQSAARIREILAEIQTALRATLTASEEGARRMNEGEQQITAAGENFRGVMSVVEQSSQAAQQIVAAVSQQNAGIAQISAAVLDLNAATESAVKGLKRTEQSTDRLSALSTRVAALVDVFRV